MHLISPAVHECDCPAYYYQCLDGRAACCSEGITALEFKHKVCRPVLAYRLGGRPDLRRNRWLEFECHMVALKDDEDDGLPRYTGTLMHVHVC